MVFARSKLTCAFGVWAMLALPSPANSQPLAPRIDEFANSTCLAMDNFNLLEGKWDVESLSLKNRMSGEQEWLENHMETEYRILLDGLVVINDTYGTFNGRPMHGIMIRTYDPDKDEWLMQWMSKGYPHLTEQVRGRFKNGIGEFFGAETNAGRTFKLRFRWKMISTDHAFWEQAYQDPATGEWEVNWTLDLRRKPVSEEQGAEFKSETPQPGNNDPSECEASNYAN